MWPNSLWRPGPANQLLAWGKVVRSMSWTVIHPLSDCARRVLDTLKYILHECTLYHSIRDRLRVLQTVTRTESGMTSTAGLLDAAKGATGTSLFTFVGWCLLFMEPWTAAKIFKIVWRCHKLMSGFLANDHLPRVSRLSANGNHNEIPPGAMNRPCGIYLIAEENPDNLS